MSESTERGCKIFDELCEEIMFGFNMKLELINLIREESDIIESLEEFLEICRTQRGK